MSYSKTITVFLLSFLAGPISVNRALGVTNSIDENETVERAQMLFSASSSLRLGALLWMRERNNTDVIAPLIIALRYVPDDRDEIAATLESLTSADHGDDWFKWMLWQQAHPEITSYARFDIFLSELFYDIDPDFRLFIYPGVQHEIRLEEITWGGVIKDGIPALINPDFTTAVKADYLTDEEPVFGVEINGDARAYPYRIMDWHEMCNDTIGGVPIALAYCTLCGSGILFDSRVEIRKKPLVFGSSGFLYRSNKLMYDRETHSLWNQFTGRPVVGRLTGSGIELKVLPLVTTTWREWREQHPDTKVLSLNTGFIRDYSPRSPYAEYFASPKLMFPALVANDRLNPKEQVFVLRISGAKKAWPLSAFNGKRVINDRVGVIDLVIIGDADNRSVRAYRSAGRTFSKTGSDLSTVEADGKIWKVTEQVLLGPNGENLTRLPGHLAYWFAWSGYVKDADYFER